ncbi:TPA: SGNH/GDSL hydrolase family protein [Clostridium botulinum]|uniref:SGNH/GDSL hydrolase family protein n=1 Tax=Clostridium botulinum TaxID=1491 RepID=UPI0008FC99DD|nr:SGNH/GDSL hydrolase family protein [Clostridium botulinum]APC80000.1 GDSL-like Lipase/Acylhydrolase family protein [Clostridium botulinum]MCS4448417.1 SGNH/GDSL hydrolase family protein [Clostridium botulinum]MCS4458297.1 SGNH/GDSL hydrolase family protein [Clostridium botulinum]MCS4460674.1 SGNH/GDSL hydrolase family protein [Clostridium botulinum]MCS4520505.1 SGNH/GDSL hydrolase family protein [Clostridium botulinum]
MKNNDFNIVFLGGSITEGTGAVAKDKAYVHIVGEYFKNLYKHKKVNIYNAGIGGTGSRFGLFRLERDVICYNPDLVFFEFSVNDRIENPFDASITTEGVVRKLLFFKNPPKIIFLITPSEMADACSSLHKKIAYYYDIPVIDIQDYVFKAIGQDKYTWSHISTDNLHPNDAGHKIYGEYIIKSIDKNKDFYFKKNNLKEKSLMGYEFKNPQIESYEKAIFYGHWREENMNIPKRIELSAVSDVVGDYLEFNFKGKYISALAIVGRECGIAEINLDGASAIIDLYSDTDNYCTPILNLKDLRNIEHKLIVKVGRNKNPRSKGHKIIIGSFLVENI